MFSITEVILLEATCRHNDQIWVSEVDSSEAAHVVIAVGFLGTLLDLK